MVTARLLVCFPTLLFIAQVLLITSCGGGDNDGNGTTSSPGLITLSSPSAPYSGNLSVPYSLTGSSDVWFEFSTDGGTTWNGAAPSTSCETTKGRIAGSHSFLWDTVADGADGQVLIRGHAGSVANTIAVTLANPAPAFLDRSASLDAAVTTGVYSPANRGFYDLSAIPLSYLTDPAFPVATTKLPVKSWRISVGRWENGPTSVFAPEAAHWSTDITLLKSATREFYRGPNTLAGAADPTNYYFAYLDSQIATVVACGAEPYLCFDYMPFTLAANQDPNTADNLYSGDSNLSFSNGIRTSPPSNPEVYAEVVKRVVMHVTGSFAGGLSQPLGRVEIGNEPDLTLSPTTYARYFWTGNSAQFTAMYQACAQALDLQFSTSITIAAGSFAFLPGEATPCFMQRFLAGLGTARMDALAYHVYSDNPENGFTERLVTAKALRDTYRPGAKLYCPEWSLDLSGSDKSRFQTMSAALHHAKVLEYFALFDVSLAHCALLRDPVADHIGLIGTAAKLKPAAYAFSAYELLTQTPNLLAVLAIAPAGKPMLIAGKDGAGAITVLFFHEKPASGVGRMTLSIAHLPFANWRIERRILTDATVAIGDGLWAARTRSGSGDLTDELRFTQDTLVAWRITAVTAAPASTITPAKPSNDG